MTFPNDPNNSSRIGRLATPREVYNNHIDGTADRHSAEQIDIDPPQNILGIVDDAQSAFENLANYFQNIVGGNLSGFTSIIDGYDCWLHADGNINFDANIPPLNTLLIPVFNSISAGNPLPGFERLKRGGILYIKPGTYYITETIPVPAGIVLFGDFFGTKIVNATNLDTTVSPPVQKLISTSKPLFKILEDTDRLTTDAAIDGSSQLDFQRKTGIINLNISDNFVEPAILGDPNYIIPQNTASTAPLIIQEQGSYLFIDNVVFAGRVKYISGQVVDKVSGIAIKTDINIPGIFGTTLKITNCSFDGFATPIQYLSDYGTEDYLLLNNNFIRAYGWLDGNNSLPDKNNIIVSNICNILCDNNYFWGADTNVQRVFYFENVIASSVPASSISKISMSNNIFTLDKLNNTSLPLYPYTSSALVISDIAKYSINISNFNDYNFSTNDIIFDVLPVPNNTFGKLKITSSQVDFNTIVNFNNDIFSYTNASFNVITGTDATFDLADITITLTANNAIITTATVNTSLDVNGTANIDGNFVSQTKTFNNGAVYNNSVIVSSSTYIMDESPHLHDFVLLVDTTSNAVSITLPPLASESNRVITIKDIGGNLNTNPITLIRADNSQKIEGLLSSKVLSANYGYWNFILDSNKNWWRI